MAERRAPPHRKLPGPLQWLRENLFSSPLNSVITVVLAIAGYSFVVPLINWAIVDAAWSGDTREACLAYESGACWPYIFQRIGQIAYGFYDETERWRVDLVYLTIGVSVLWLLVPSTPSKWPVALFCITGLPILAYVALAGGFGLREVPLERWGGFLITIVVAATGIAFSLPIGILLALGRRSELPVVRGLSVAFIELWRGVPLVTVLFMAVNMLPLFLPEGLTLNKLLNALIAVVLFSSAYMAEVVRGGLQAVNRGQYEAAAALGLGYWRSMGFIILPQALRLALPNIVGNFIGLLKDTSLVSIIGFLDLLGVIQAGNADAAWATPNTAMTGYLFLGLVYWVMCFSMSQYARSLEARLQREESKL